ncbi:hypothetical protein D3C76_1355120 [compost metagenome]
MRADAAQNSEHCLDKQRWCYELAVEEVRQVIQVGSVIAFKFKASPVVRAGLKDVLNVFERVAKDYVASPLKILGLPRVLEFFVATKHRKQSEVHRPHVQ